MRFYGAVLSAVLGLAQLQGTSTISYPKKASPCFFDQGDKGNKGDKGGGSDKGGDKGGGPGNSGGGDKGKTV